MAAPSPYTDHPASLLRHTQQHLRKDGRSLFTIAQESGLPFYWLRKFATGEVKSPSVNRVQRLYEFLTKSKLSLT